MKDGQVSVVCPAAFKQDGGVSEQAADAVPTGILQTGCYCQSCYSHCNTVTLQTATTGSICRWVFFISESDKTV